jgi:hypothetical protein
MAFPFTRSNPRIFMRNIFPRRGFRRPTSLIFKVQGLACFLTTEAINGSPSIALETMLDLPSLPALVKKEAAQSAFLIHATQYRGLGGEHLKINTPYQNACH